MIEFRNEEIEALQERIARELGFELVGHRLELYGVPVSRRRKRRPRGTLQIASVQCAARAVLAAFFALTVPLMPLQALLLRICSGGARAFPHWYHRQVCRLLGIRLHLDGAVARDRPVLLVSNHTSWLDIPVLSAVAPVSFVAKSEVGTWPFVSSLARLQRTVFVDRDGARRSGSPPTRSCERLAQGDTIVLFAEGTSSDGNRVLPFMTSLFAAAKPLAGEAGAAPDAVVQTLSLVYTQLHGVPLGALGSPARRLVRRHGDARRTPGRCCRPARSTCDLHRAAHSARQLRRPQGAGAA